MKSRREKETLRRLLADYGDGLMDHHSEILRARLLAGAPMSKIAEHRGLPRATAYKRLREAAEALLALAPGEDPAHAFFEAHTASHGSVVGDYKRQRGVETTPATVGSVQSGQGSAKEGSPDGGSVAGP